MYIYIYIYNFCFHHYKNGKIEMVVCKKKKQLKLSSDSNERIRKDNIFKDIKNLFSVKKEIDNSATKQILLL